MNSPFLVENFSGANGLPLENAPSDNGGNWHKLAGANSILRLGNGTATAGGGAQYYNDALPPSAEYDNQLDFFYPATVTGNNYIGVSSHASLSGDEYIFYASPSAGGYQLFKNTTAAGLVQLGSTDTVAIPADSLRRCIRISTRKSGANLIISGYVNEDLAVSYTDISPLAPGYAGLHCIMSTPQSLVFATLFATGFPSDPKFINYGEIGDSVTAGSVVGAQYAPSVFAQALLSVINGTRIVKVSNQGLSGAESAVWVSGSTNLTNAKAAFVAAFGVPSALNPVYVGIRLGVNDCNNSTARTPANFAANIASLCRDLLSSGYIPIIHYPTFGIGYDASQAPYTHDSRSDALLRQYLTVLDSLCDESSVFSGDRQAYDYGRENRSQYIDSLHPNQIQSQSLGERAARAVYRVANRVNPSTAGINENPYSTQQILDAQSKSGKVGNT